jgi:hypothetical protein
MTGKRKRNSRGIEIGGNVRVSQGDFVAGDKTVKVDKGGVLIGGNVQGSNIITGDKNQVGNQTSAGDQLFEELIRRIEKRPNTSREDKEDLKANVEEIKLEAAKGEQADASFLSRRLRNIQRIAPDIAEVVLATITNPVAGFAKIIQKVAERARKSTSE